MQFNMHLELYRKFLTKFTKSHQHCCMKLTTFAIVPARLMKVLAHHAQLLAPDRLGW